MNQPKGANPPSRGAAMPHPAWKWRPFVLSHAAAAILAASWAFQPTRVLWDALDAATFRLLNGSLDDAPWWQFFWALTNHRAIDVISGSLAAIVVICWVWGEPRTVQNARAAALAALAIPVIILPFAAHYVLEKWFDYERHSPTIVYEDALRLTELVPAFVTKDSSRYSFPGDHAFVLFSLVLFYWYFGARKFVAISLVMAVIFMLPRLFAGAHWLTDNIVGGTVPALIVTAWVMATPAGHYLARIVRPPIDFVVAALPPWLRIPEHKPYPGGAQISGRRGL